MHRRRCCCAVRYCSGTRCRRALPKLAADVTHPGGTAARFLQDVRGRSVSTPGLSAMPEKATAGSVRVPSAARFGPHATVHWRYQSSADIAARACRLRCAANGTRAAQNRRDSRSQVRHFSFSGCLKIVVSGKGFRGSGYRLAWNADRYCRTADQSGKALCRYCRARSRYLRCSSAIASCSWQGCRRCTTSSALARRVAVSLRLRMRK